MKRDKEWLKGKLNTEKYYRETSELKAKTTYGELYDRGVSDGINVALELVEQLNEPEVLSQKWIDENVVEGDFRGGQQFWYGRFIEEEKVKNLLVPKQEKTEVEENFYTFDNAKKWLQENGFVVFEKNKLNEEVQRMIDETYKAMSEKPAIPQFVADYYNDYKDHELTFAEWFECAEPGKGGKTENKTFEWLLDNTHEVNTERQFILADIIAHGLDGYEVEKEKVYIIKFAPSIYGTPTYGSIDTQNGKKIMQSIYGSPGKVVTPNQYTEEEIKEVGSKYMAFAEEVVE